MSTNVRFCLSYYTKIVKFLPDYYIAINIKLLKQEEKGRGRSMSTLSLDTCISTLTDVAPSHACCHCMSNIIDTSYLIGSLFQLSKRHLPVSNFFSFGT